MINKTSAFQKRVKDFYLENFRPMPWRESRDPYAIFLSEVMLQQTQVDRVMPKFVAFIQTFPTVQSLADALFKEVLGQWAGLGYNRRALWLHEAAKEIVRSHGGKIPVDPLELVKLKGVGPNTAAAICVYAFNLPLVFIETNIRAVYIHHFFEDRDDVYDNEIFSLVKQTLDEENPREWYWALMDYGVHLKKTYKNPARKSKHHAVQSTFEGSRRQLRGNILKLLLKEPSISASLVADVLHDEKKRVEDALETMEKEGLLSRDRNDYTLR